MAAKSLIDRLASFFSGRSRTEEIRLNEPYRLSDFNVRVPFEVVPICVNLVREKVRFIVDRELYLDDACNKSLPRFLLFDPNRYASEVSGFLRLSKQGDSFILGSQYGQKLVGFDLPENMELRQLSISHDGDALIFRKLISDTEIELIPSPKDHVAAIFHKQREEKLRTIRRIYGGSVELLSPSDGLKTLQQVNDIMASEVYRASDDRGRPGGVLNLPGTLLPIIVGDLHAQIDNLLTLLSQNHFMEALENGEAALIILGDAVHPEFDDQLEEMENSLLLMDLIFRLKLRFPEQLFYIRGNHDSFSNNLTKFGVAQCLIWEASIRKRRGEAYLKEMKRFYDSLPYVVISEEFLACHAAPIKTRFDKNRLINIYRYPGLVRELTRNRLRRRTSPAGYTKADVRHFKKTLEVPEHIPFFVSHSPLDREQAYWLKAGNIKSHHIVFSANIPWIGVFTRVGKRIMPLSYHRENILSIINKLPIEKDEDTV